jgi:carboxylesterase type B
MQAEAPIALALASAGVTKIKDETLRTRPVPGDSEATSCLRNAPVAALLAAQGTIKMSPTAATTILPQGLSDAFSSGNFNRVSVMRGTNFNEGRHFEPAFFDPTHTFVPGGRAQFGVDNLISSRRPPTK